MPLGAAGSLRMRAAGRAAVPPASPHARPAARVLPMPLRAAAALPRLLGPSPASPARRLPPAPALSPTASLLASLTASASAASPSALHPAISNLAALLPALGTFALCLAAAALLLAAIPAAAAMARAAARAERVLAVMESELPDTLAAMRLSGLEVTDCIQELGALGGELTRGVRSAANLATMAEAGVRGGVAAAEGALQGHVKPAVARAETEARSAVEAQLQQSAQLPYKPGPLVGQAAASVTLAVRRLRLAMALGQVAAGVVQAGRTARDNLQRQQPATATGAYGAPGYPASASSGSDDPASSLDGLEGGSAASASSPSTARARAPAGSAGAPGRGQAHTPASSSSRAASARAAAEAEERELRRQLEELKARAAAQRRMLGEQGQGRGKGGKR